MPGLLFDTNIRMALTFPTHPHHELAVTTLGNCATDNPACFCRFPQQSFLSHITSAQWVRTCQSPEISNRNAIAILTGYLERPFVGFREESPGTSECRLRMADRNSASPKLWMDAYLTASSISGNLRLDNFDSDFRQFESQGLDLLLLQS